MKSSKGFTLIELIVVIAVFLFVIGAAIGIFISIMQHQKRILSEQELLNQASYIMEYMSKAMRMARKDLTGDCLIDDQGNSWPGYVYLLTKPDNSTGFYKGVKFINQSDCDIEGNCACQQFYAEYIDPNNHAMGFILKETKKYNYSESDFPVFLTSNNLKINYIRFGVNGRNGCYGAGCANGAQESDDVQPRITVFLNIQTQGNESQPIKKIQTTVSQRGLNIK
ncbi:MAG: hypothetical protein CEN87_59 [Parcubacteria group bacterium Licking1014_1]|nr:MAG: hypothetical protein CEN87_59 [Parcubacteria group bacterium Licking1014_1]